MPKAPLYINPIGHTACCSFEHETWFGFNLLAIDKSTIRVPDEYEISNHFGAWNSTKGKKNLPKSPCISDI
jgi:hypothetical protein